MLILQGYFEREKIIFHEKKFETQKNNLINNRFQFLKINSLMAETILKTFPKRNFYKQTAEFNNNLFIFKNWKRSSCIESFP